MASYPYGDYNGSYSGYSNYGYPASQAGGGSMLGGGMDGEYSPNAPQANFRNYLNNIMNGANTSYRNAMGSVSGTGQAQGAKKSGGGLFGGIKSFFKGIAKGATNLVKSLMDPKTWLMILACAALVVVYPPAGLALFAMGVGMAGMQIYQGASTGDWEKAGEGTFNMGLSFVGGRGAATSVKGADGAKYSRYADEAQMAKLKVKDAQAALDKAKAAKTKETAGATAANADEAAVGSAAKSKKADEVAVAKAKDIKLAEEKAAKLKAEAEAAQKDYQATQAKFDKANTEKDYTQQTELAQKMTTKFRASEDAAAAAKKAEADAVAAAKKADEVAASKPVDDIATLEKNLEAAKKAAEKAKALQVKMEVANLNKWERNKLVDKENQAKVKEAKDKTKTEYKALKDKAEARQKAKTDQEKANLESQKTADEAQTAKDQKTEKAADSDKTPEEVAELAALQKARIAYRTEKHKMALIERAEKVNQKSAYGHFKSYLDTTWISTKANFSTLAGKPLSAVDGRKESISLYSREPKALNTDRTSNSPSWFKRKKKEEPSPTGKSDTETKPNSEESVQGDQPIPGKTPEKLGDKVKETKTDPKTGTGKDDLKTDGTAEKPVKETETHSKPKETTEGDPKSGKDSDNPTTDQKKKPNKAEENSYLKRYKEYLRSNLFSSIAQANTAGAPLLQMTGFGQGGMMG